MLTYSSMTKFSPAQERSFIKNPSVPSQLENETGYTMLNFVFTLPLFVALSIADTGVATEDGVVMDEAALAMLRRLAQKVPPLDLKLKRAFTPDTKYADWMGNLPEKIQNMPLSGEMRKR